MRRVMTMPNAVTKLLLLLLLVAFDIKNNDKVENIY